MSETTGTKVAYGLAAAADVASCSTKHLMRQIAAGKLRAKRDGKTYRILATDLNKWLESLPDAA